MDLIQIQQNICDTVQKGVQNSEIVSTIELLGGYLNAETVASWAKKQNIDYTTAKYRIAKGNLTVFELFGQKFIIDNQ